VANPYFQPVRDLIAAHPPPNGNLGFVLKLCEAVEAEHTAEIPLLTVRVVKNVSPNKTPPVLIPEAVWYETMARLLFLNEQSNLQLLLDWYEPPVSFAITAKDKITEHWQGLIEFITLPSPSLTEQKLDKLLAGIVAALKIVLDEFLLAKAEEGKAKPPDFDPSSAILGTFGNAPHSPPARSAVLTVGILRLVQSWMAVHQQFLDAAWGQLGAGGRNRGDKLLALRRRWLAALNATFANPRFNKESVAQIRISLGKIRYGRSPHHEYLDAFPLHDSRVFGFTPYDRDPDDEPPGKKVRLDDLVQYRNAQLHFLLDEFGEYYPPVPPPSTFTARADELGRKLRYGFRSKIIDAVERKGGSLKWESEDDLVSFGCALYQVVSSASGQQASTAYGPEFWKVLLDMFAGHLRTHTVHSEFNMDESPPFFDRLFPRAINGGVWHDCAVYAVRLAFVFFALAECMKSAEYPNPPKISFIMFPLHVGLIVELDGMLPIIIHNEVLFRLTDEQMQAANEEWAGSPEQLTDPKDSEKLHQKFIEDIAAQVFLRDVNLPLLRVPIAPLSRPAKKTEIWKAFGRQVVDKIGRLLSTVIARSTSPYYQFDTRFLFEMTREKQWHDENVVPFWKQGMS
jgi:hypothetical protein